MGKTTNVLLGLALAGSLALGWCNNSKKQNKIDTLESELKADSISHGVTLRKLEDKSNSFERLSGSYEEINNEIKELKDKYSQTKDNLNKMEREKSYLLARLEKFKELNSSVNILDSLKREIGLRDEKHNKLQVGLKKLENEIKLGAEKYANLEKKYRAFLKKPEKHLLDSLEKEIMIFKELYEKLYQEKSLEESVRENISAHSPYSLDSDYSLKVKETKGFFGSLFESKRPKLVKIGEKYTFFKDDSPKMMQAFVVDSEGRQRVLKKVDDQGIFSYSHLKFEDGQHTFYAVDKDGNESPKYIRYIKAGVISNKSLD